MASITVLFGSDNVGTHKIVCHPFVVGRDLSCELTIDNVGVSREHCRFLWDGKHFFVEDMGSANGTFHHGHKIRKASLGNGDKIQIGKYTLIFSETPGESPPADKGGEVVPAGPGRRAEKSAASDNLLTFKMDARQLQARIAEAEARPGSAPQRAADLAKTFTGGASGAATVRTRRPRSFLGSIVRLLAVTTLIAALGAAALIALKSFGLIGG
jgi:pSer/pThr/pTyr-binding forkhead associated (FHA) protein